MSNSVNISVVQIRFLATSRHSLKNRIRSPPQTKLNVKNLKLFSSTYNYIASSIMTATVASPTLDDVVASPALDSTADSHPLSASAVPYYPGTMDADGDCDFPPPDGSFLEDAYFCGSGAVDPVFLQEQIELVIDSYDGELSVMDVKRQLGMDLTDEEIVAVGRRSLCSGQESQYYLYPARH